MFLEVCRRNPTKKQKEKKKHTSPLEQWMVSSSTIYRLRHHSSPLMWIHRDGPRLTQLSGDQNFPLPAISRGNRDALVARVSPVDVLVDPVNSQAFGGVQRVDERHLLRRIAGLVDVSASGGGAKDSFVSTILFMPPKIVASGSSIKQVRLAAIPLGLLTVRKTRANHCGFSRCSLLWMMVCRGT